MNMYEFQLTNRLNTAVQTLCTQHGLSRVKRILIKVGGLRRINPELMTFIFASLSRGTPAEGAILSVMMVPVTFKCYTCGKTWTTTEDAEFLCPACQSRNVDLLNGLELGIDFIDVERELL